MDWSVVDYCDVFISCLDSHSDGTHSLQSIHCWASDVMPHFSKSVLMKKQTPLYLRWPEGEYICSKLLSIFMTVDNIQDKSGIVNANHKSWKLKLLEVEGLIWTRGRLREIKTA